MHPYLRHNALKHLVPALRPRSVITDGKPSIIDRVLANVHQRSQEYAHGNVYETLIPSLTRQVMAGLWAYDLVEVEPTHQPIDDFIQHPSRHFYGHHNQIVRLVEEIAFSINEHLVHQLYNMADAPPFTGDL